MSSNTYLRFLNKHLIQICIKMCSFIVFVVIVVVYTFHYKTPAVIFLISISNNQWVTLTVANYTYYYTLSYENDCSILGIGILLLLIVPAW